MIKYFIFIIIYIMSTCKYGFTYLNTIESSLIERDKFLIEGGVKEYFRNDTGSVYVLPFRINLGLARRVEFLGIFPYIQLRKYKTPEIETFGDIILYLKFDLGVKYFKYPEYISENFVYNQFVLLMGFNIATGPTEEENREFKPYSYGLPDWRLGLLYSQYIDDFSFDFNFIYVFVQHQGEDYLPFSDKIWDKANKIYLFNIPRVLIKFFWPGKDPFAPDDAEDWEKYPHLDDYFIMNFGFDYYFEPSFLYFTYDLFFEINWFKTWSSECYYDTYINYSLGLAVNINDETSIFGGFSGLFQKKLDNFFYNIYYLSIRFTL